MALTVFDINMKNDNNNDGGHFVYPALLNGQKDVTS